MYTISKFNRRDDNEVVVKPNESTIDREPVEKEKLFDIFERKIIHLLLDAGADSETAVEAGRSVHSYAEDVSRRRSIRWFLTKRDSLWANSAFASASSLASREMEEVNCDIGGVRNVVNLLMDAGLNGKDCASVLAHTPSLAFRSTVEISQEGDDEIEEEASAKRTRIRETIKTTVDRALNRVLCGALQLRKYDARKVRHYQQLSLIGTK